MKTVLIVPDSPPRQKAQIRQRYRLTLPTKGSEYKYGMGITLRHRRGVFDGFNFRILRDTLGARIETTDPERVYSALGVPEGELGIEHARHSGREG